MSYKAKILFIVPLPPPVHGSSMMCDYIRQSKLINNEFKCDYINLSTSRSIDEIGKNGIRKWFRISGALLKTLWKLMTKKYDICYIALTCHGNGFLKDAPFALLCKLFGRKLIIHQHNKGMSKDIGSHWRVKLLKSVYKNATVILLSWNLYSDIEEIVGRDQIRICPNGIPINPLFNSLPVRNNRIPHILFLSNLIPSKGVYVLLDALKILKDIGYHFMCNFVGGESTEISADTFDRAVSTRQLNECVKYLGKKYGKEKIEIFSSHDIFVFPTYYDNECFPLVLLEAMQAGLPCISTTEGAIPDLLNETGLIVPTKNPDAVAEAIKQLLTDKQLYDELSQESYKRFKSEFSLQVFESNLIHCLNKTIGQ